MKCDVCGTESDFEEAFFKERKSFRKSIRTLCPTCQTRRVRTFHGWYQVAIIIGGIVGYVLLWLNIWPNFAETLTGLFLFDIFLILTIIPHELGHAIAGKLLGWRVFVVAIGIGKQIFKFSLFGIAFSFHWLPVGGITRLAPVDTRWFRTKRFIIFLAGPAVNAIIAALIICISRRNGGVSFAGHLCFFANLWVLCVNLLPIYSKTMQMDTDGAQLLKTFSKNQKDAEELQASRFALEAILCRDEKNDYKGALDWCNKGLALFPQNIHLLNMSGILYLDRQNYNRAREIFVQLLSDEVKPQIRYMLLNNIAYTDALTGDPKLLPEADAYSKEAYDNAPWALFIVGTRGTVLVEMGQLEAGIKLLKEAFETYPVIHSKALNASYLAIAYSRTGDRQQAENYLKLARQLDPKCSLLERAETELNGGPVKRA